LDREQSPGPPVLIRARQPAIGSALWEVICVGFGSASVLLTSGEFVRPLPGIYAVPEQIPAGSTILFDPPKFLLAEEQVRYLAEARYAEEPFGRFPLWIPEAEYALCRWAQGNSNPLLFQSLLAVASIELWPVSSKEREHWSALMGLVKPVESRSRKVLCSLGRPTGGFSLI
jgi:hypothetical protein